MAEARYDAERFLDDILAIVKANLNTEITAIQAEKDILLGSSNFTLKTVSDNAYFDSLDEGVANYDPFIYFGIEDDPIVPMEGAGAENIRAFFYVVLHNSFKDKNVYKRMLRYARALKQITEKNFDKISQIGNIRVEAMTPTNFQDLESNTFYKMAGISLSLSIA